MPCLWLSAAFYCLEGFGPLMRLLTESAVIQIVVCGPVI